MEGRAIARPNRLFRPKIGGLERASMEGRAIARPNPGRRHRNATTDQASMEGRAIARPNEDHRGLERIDRAASMEGRAIARPNRRTAAHRQRGHLASMEGRAIARPNGVDGRGCVHVIDWLQWRAGQLPGQTGLVGDRGPPSPRRFNGGPGNCPAKLARDSPRACRWSGRFNGGPGNCPAKRSAPASWSSPRSSASMEGRAIARPNRRAGVQRPAERGASMEGRAIARPNCPGPTHEGDLTVALQWRAGQLPGQTRSRWRWCAVSCTCFNGGPGNCPAKPSTGPGTCASSGCFNGGPGNCPAKPEHHRHSRPPHAQLQWRAGQLPGQTGRHLRGRHRRGRGFNGGPGNCPAKPWSALTAPSGSPPRFNGGPGNCPAKRGDRSKERQMTTQASMEGRAIARPNAGEGI